MAYKKNKETEAENKSSGNVFDLSHPLFDSTVNPGTGEVLGTVYKVLDVASYNALPSVMQSEWNAPAIISFGLTPTFGVSTDRNSPVNLAATNLFKLIQNAIRKVNLGYQSSDIMMQLAAHDSIFMMYHYIKRAHMLVNNYNPWNRYVNDAIYSAMFIDGNSFKENASQIAYDLRIWEMTLKNFPIPSRFEVFAMHSAMLSQIFTDASTTAKAQMYVFNPDYLYKYPTFTGTKPATYELDVVQVRPTDETHGLTYAECKTIFTNLLNAIIASDDFQQINSNLLSAFEGEAAYAVQAPSDTDAVPVVYSEEVLDAITNAKILPLRRDDVKSFAPKCTANNTIVISPTIHDMTLRQTQVLGVNCIINATRESLDAKSAARCVRWCPVVDELAYVSAKGSCAVDAVGTEVITSMHVTGSAPMGLRSSGNILGVRHFYDNSLGGDTSSLMGAYYLMGFSYAPTMYHVISNSVFETASNWVYPVAQWTYTYHIDRDSLTNIHHAYLWQALMRI